MTDERINQIVQEMYEPYVRAWVNALMDTMRVSVAAGCTNPTDPTNGIAPESAASVLGGCERKRDEMPEKLPVEAIPTRDDIRDILNIALARAWRADANLDVSIRELQRAQLMAVCFLMRHECRLTGKE